MSETTYQTAAATVAADGPRKGRQSQIVQDTLMQEIDQGLLRPGTVLEERALAERFGVSRTPVREALKHLAYLGLVKLTPHAGTQVARKTIAELRALLEYVGELEPICAKLTARRVDAALRARLEAAYAQCEASAHDPVRYSHANAGFHEVIYDGCHNAYLARQIKQVRRQVKMYSMRDTTSQANIQRSLEEHAAILRAICAGDERRAMEAMMKHIPAGNSGFSEFLAKVPMHYFDHEVVST